MIILILLTGANIVWSEPIIIRRRRTLWAQPPRLARIMGDWFWGGGQVPPPARKHCDFASERGKRGKNPSTSVPNYWMGFYL